MVPEASLRQGYSRDLFPHWQDVNGSGCTTRQDLLLAQAIGLSQRDLFDPCVIVEGDWYSLFDGVTYSGAPGEIDIDHVVALSEAWDSGAAAWPTELRRRFANDPLNLLVVTRVSNQSKADKDAGEWKPARRDAWCVTATMMIFTKARYSLTIDARERTGLAEMAETCDEPDQRAVPGLPLPGTADFDSVEPVVIPPPTTAPPPPASTDCTEDQVDINRASETELQRIIHIGAETARFGSPQRRGPRAPDNAHAVIPERQRNDHSGTAQAAHCIIPTTLAEAATVSGRVSSGCSRPST